MSPRSEEFLQAARRHLAGARMLLDGGIPENAAGEAYFAMVNAARAALSERDKYSKTHSGLWFEFRQEFISTGEIGAELARAAELARDLREASDYRAGGASEEQAQRALAAADELLAEVERLFGPE